MKKVVLESVCRRQLQSRVGEQKMTDLPADRFKVDSPFTYCGCDAFGHFIIKEGRKDVKRYGILYTCFASRAIHNKTTCTLDTDSFLLSFRRFTS